MNALRDSARGARIAGTILVTAPMLDVLLGGAFGPVHAVVGIAGLAMVVPATFGKEA
jgi:hypothetical protein